MSAAGCLRPDRLADFARGRLPAKRASSASEHLAACADCRTALTRVESAQQAMREVVSLPVPELGSLRTEATLRWTRVASRPSLLMPRPGFALALGVVACAGLLAVWTGRSADLSPRPVIATGSRIEKTPPLEAAAPLEAIVTLLAGEVRLERGGAMTPLDMGALVHGGDRLLTGAGGRVGLQWGEGSGLVASSGTELTLAKLLDRHQRFALARGKLDLRVGPHREGETLEVVAPAHLVSVRGTWFTVAADARRTTVEVFEGVVEVTERDGSATTLLRAPATAVFDRGRAVTTSLDARGLAALRRAHELGLLPWPSLDAARAASGLLSVASDPEGTLAVDGVELGSTPIWLRRPLGRHLVEISRRGFDPLQHWVSVGHEPGELRLALSRVPVEAPLAEPVAIEEMVHERGRQIRACYERGLKRDPKLAGTISLKLRVGDAGQVRSVTIDESTLSDPRVGDCLRREAMGWSFKTGRNATIVYPLVFRPQ